MSVILYTTDGDEMCCEINLQLFSGCYTVVQASGGTPQGHIRHSPGCVVLRVHHGRTLQANAPLSWCYRRGSIRKNI